MGNSQSSEIAGVDQLYADLHNRAVRTNDAAVLGASVQAGNRLLSIMPPDHPRRGMRCVDFAKILHRSYQQTKEVASLEKAVELTREALTLRPGRDSRAKACALLAALLLDLGLISEDSKLFMEAAELCREAIKLLPMSDPNQPAQHTTLARCLTQYYRISGEEPLLHESIQLYRGVLAQIPADRPSRVTQAENFSEKLITSKETPETPGGKPEMSVGRPNVAQGDLDIARKNLAAALEDLAKLLCKQLDPECDDALLDRILDTRREIMRLTPTHAPQRGRRMWNLAVHLARCFKRGGGLELIDEAIRLSRQMLSLDPAVTDPDRRAQYTVLGTSLASKFNRTKDHASLEEAAQALRQARSLCAADDRRGEEICANLSSVLRVLQARQADDRAVLDDLVEVDREVVRLRGPSHSRRAEACRNLSKSLVSLLKQTRDMQTMEEIIRLNREVLDLQPEGHPNHEDACINLAISLHARVYNSQNKDADDEAISLARTALALQTVGHSDRLPACGILADMLAWRSKTFQDQDLGLIDESITLYREATSLPRVNRPALLLQLVDSLIKRHSLTKDDTSLEQAILLLRESLAATPPSLDVVDQLQPQTCSNLSSCLLEAFERTRNPVFGRESSYFLKEATARSLIGHPLRCIDLVKLTLLPMWLGDIVDVAATVLLLEEAVATATISVHTWYPVLVNLAYSGFWTLGTEDVPDHLVQRVLSLYSSIVSITGVVSSCPRDLQCLVPHVTGSFIFTLAKRADDLAFALDHIERSRDLFWTCALQRQRDLLEDIPADVVEEFASLVQVAPMEKVKSQDARFLQLIEDIRSRPGLDRFMRGPDSDALMSTAAGGPVVMLIPTGETCQALIIRAPKEPITTICLAYSGVFGATPSTLFRGDTSNVTEVDDPDEGTRIREALATLWREVVKPIIDHLGITVSVVSELP
jgi:tetratricopeptide (TPR) repeat protein